MTWVNFMLVALAVCGWTVAAGLYLQLKDALRLAEQWRSIANDAWGDVVRERHLAEFAVRQLPPPPYGKTFGNPKPRGKTHTVNETARMRVVDDA